ncbi:sulfatase-like hydrolase/transferase [Luteimonas sp BLCC-B24]|uniref:sulfatase-like hydrolase/transferase n=1 Tax=Luteimonas sp. BLCC-B24 TaxID=3025317 RepID=UPI00234DDC38|nr:sulfatase-like hydrolase/transferase [Luteimonas sp. BLCC-B24]MDC7807767.1 sulfatase-like hydrolase/transferase [Luteimonas sp. BLCC-B24]
MRSQLADSRRLARRLTLELACWGSLTGAFLFIYVGTYGADAGVVLPHATVILAFWSGLVGIRLMLWRLFPAREAFLRASALLVLTPPVALAAWYMVTLVGLSSWGRVPTWSLVWTYAKQSPHLIATLGLPGWWLPLAAAGLTTFVAVIVWKAPRVDWCEIGARRLSPSGLSTVASCCVALAFTQGMRLSSMTDFHHEEPIGAGFFAARSAEMQTHAATASPALDAAERHARAHYATTTTFAHRNVVLIIGDALRASHMGLYGYHRQTTPDLEASTHHHQTWIAPTTKAICAESLCGLLALSSSRTLQSMPTSPITLHEVLRLHGYRIRLALGGDHTHFYGLRDSYGPAESYFDGTEQSARYVNDDLAVLDHIDTLPDYDGRHPELLQLHLMSTHGLGTKHDAPDAFAPSTNYYRWPGRPGGRVPPSAEDAERAVNHYDNGVRQFDRLVSTILKALEAKGYLQNALVLVTGDHGEMLGETGVFGHQHSVDEAVLTVPLVVQRRGYSGSDFGAWPLASQIDVAPTILAELGIAPPSTWRGVALQSTPFPRFVYFRQGSYSGAYFQGRDALFKYWTEHASAASHLSDATRDPLGQQNLAPLLRPGLAGQLMLKAMAGAP